MFLLLVQAGVCLCAQEKKDAEEPLPITDTRYTTADIYQGTAIKLDLGSSAVVLGASKGQIQHYELAVNCRLKNRFYPVLELGYAGGKKIQGDTLNYRGQGGFGRVGLDINPLKKHMERPHALLIGIRIGTAVQQMNQYNENAPDNIVHALKADCWGEVVAGCQVDVYKGFTMGWMGRFRFLFTRRNSAAPAEALQAPLYIPGFGIRDNIGWGLSYYIGYKF